MNLVILDPWDLLGERGRKDMVVVLVILETRVSEEILGQMDLQELLDYQ